MFVVTLPASEADPAAYAQRAKRAGAGMLEVRGDLSPELGEFACCLPIIASPRGMSADWIDALSPRYVDLDLTEEAIDLPENSELIRSHHDYTATPADTRLEAIADGLSSSGARVVKLATRVCDYEDIGRLERLRDRLPPQAIVLGMGDKAHLQRLLAVPRNSWNYTCMSSVDAAAPGQIDLETHRLFESAVDPKMFGVIGGTGLRSRGPATHGRWIRDHAVSAVYSQFPCDDFAQAFRQLKALGVQGFSVTSPFKVTASEIADERDALVDEIGSANTLVHDGSKWVAYCTDVEGIVSGFPELRDLETVRIVGAGGVVPAVIRACRELGVREVQVWSRRREQAETLRSQFGVTVAEDLDAGHVDALICTISEDVELPLPCARACGIAIDLRYGAATAFLERAAELGYATQDGALMFEYQARAQFRLFTGIEIHGEQ